MKENEFAPLSQVLNYDYCRELLDEKIMPAAVVCLTDSVTDNVYSVRGHNRLAGLPVIDLARIDPGETPEHFVEFKLGRLFNFRLPPDALQLVPVESMVSPYMRSIGNGGYPDVHHRMYFPVLGSTGHSGGVQGIEAIPRDTVLDSVAAPEGGEVLYQLLDVQRHILEDYNLVH